MQWLSDTPMAIVTAAIMMLPRLQAEESLQEVSRMSVGAGNMKQDDRHRAIRRWERQARPRIAVRQVSGSLSPESATKGTGIGVVREALGKSNG